MRCLVFLAALALAAAAAHAQDAAVRLEPPACASMPFAHAELARLLAVELAVHGGRLVPAGGVTVIRYGALECGAASSPIWARIERAGSELELRVRESSPRALALVLAEVLREPPGEARDEPRDEPPAGAVEVEPSPAGPPIDVLAELTPPRVMPPRAPAPPRIEVGPAEPLDRSIAAGSIASGALTVDFLGNPLSQSWLLGLRVEGAIRLPQWRHLRVHVDSGFAMGRSDWAIHLGAVSVGVTVGIAMGSADLSLELGARLGVAYVGGISFPSLDIVEGPNGVVSVAGVARGQVRVAGALSLIADVELGAAIEEPGLGSVFFDTNPSCAVSASACQGGGVQGFVALVRAGVMID
ncbi:MAG: hypothetical protein IT378_00760 [Sandaracinaceae bacterium]|nr:hypothetical protein [Sandaracinaceae bacterium]